MSVAVPVIFVTGTDTEVGKTFCSAALLGAAVAQGDAVAGYKPVASGVDAEGLNADVLALRAASSCRGAYADHNGYTLAEATAPHLAAADTGVVLAPERLSGQLADWRSRADRVLVEGAGGWHTPLYTGYALSDWVTAEALPVVLVVGMKLGTINHALLTAQAVRAAGLPLAGWIANCLQPEPHRLADYMATLVAALPAPLLGLMPYAPQRPEEHVSWPVKL